MQAFLRTVSQKTILLGLISLLLVSSLSVATRQIAFGQSTDCKSADTVTLAQQIDSPGKYAIWVLIKRDTPSANAYVHVNNGACQQLNTGSANDWTWVSGSGGTVTSDLISGIQNFNFSATSGSVLFDKMLATTDTNCTPTGNGENCIREPLNLYIQGISGGGDQIEGSRIISATVISSPATDISVRYLIDGNEIKSTTTAPYCLSGDTSCTGYDFSQYGVGSHNLTVIAESGGDSQQLDFPFEVVLTSIPTPIISERPPEIVSQLPASQTSTTPIDIVITGITDNETVSGARKISATLANVSGPASVRFTLNGVDMNSDYNAPYCATPNGNECGEWQSSSIPNGTYVLEVSSAATGFMTSSKTIKINVQNSAASTGSTTTQSNSGQELVVGSPSREVNGVVRVSVPNARLQPNTTITYRLDDQVVGTANGSNPSVLIDTSGVPNGSRTLSATITKASGQQEKLTSKVTVKNDPVTSIAGWLRSNATEGLIIGSVGILGVMGVVILIKRRRNQMRFTEHHNISQEYSYVAPAEKAWQPYAARAMASFVILFSVFTIVGRFGVLEAAPGNGFILDIEDGTGQFVMDYAPGMTIRYARITVADVPTTTSTPSNGTPSTETPPASTPATPTPTPSTPTPTPSPSTPVDTSQFHLPSGGHSTHNLAIPRPAVGQTGRLIGPAFHPLGYNGDGSPDGPGNGAGAFRTWCYFSHMNYDDPIVKPGKPGESHLHQFFGNTTINAFTTNTMTGAPSTCRGGNINQSGYWQPAMIDTNGNVIVPDGVLTYYKRGYQGVTSNSIIQSPPAGLKMVAGNAMGTTPGDGKTIFTCLRSNGVRVDPISIGGCNAGDQMEMSVSFPQCWNGRDLDSPNHKSHMSYATWGVGCPASHPVAITDIVMNVYYVRALREHGSSNGWRLVTDNYDGPGGFSAHADWWNGWAPDVMDTIVANCIRGGLDCRSDQLGDGSRALYCNKGFKSPDDNGGYADFFICQ